MTIGSYLGNQIAENLVAKSIFTKKESAQVVDALINM
jgi:hypothetical protein